MSAFYEDDEPLEQIRALVDRGRAARAEAELNHLLAAAAKLDGPWEPDTPEQQAERAEIQAFFGPMQTIYRE